MKVIHPPNNNPQRIQTTFGFLVITIILIMSAWFSFSRAWQDVQSPEKKIFQFEKFGTWQILRPFWGGFNSGITRMVVVDSFETVLTTRQQWRELEFNFHIEHPNDFGLAYNYIDDQNYSFLMIYPDEHVFLWGFLKDGKPIKQAREYVTCDFNGKFKFKIGSDKVELFNSGQLLTSLTPSVPGGKAGIMVVRLVDPKIQVNQISILGTNIKGEVVKISDINNRSINIPLSVWGFYTICLFILFNLKLTVKNISSSGFPFNVIHWLKSLTVKDRIFYFIAYIGGGLYFTRIMQIAALINWKRFGDLEEWRIAISSLSVYLIILGLAVLYRRLWKLLNIPVLFLGILLTLYCLSLINVLTVKINDVVFLRGCLIVLYIPIILKLFQKKSVNVYNKLPSERISFVNILVFLWCLYALMYCFEYNFHKYRYPHSDEQNLWFMASKNMVDLGVEKTGKEIYPAGRMHSFGIPFITALPAMFWGQNFPPIKELTDGINRSVDLKSIISTDLQPWETSGKYDSPLILFFMPFVVILSLLLFFNEIKKYQWCFLYFYLGLFFTLDFNWIGHLVYRSIYAEGIALMYFVSLIYSMWMVINKSDVKHMECFLLSFFIGLLSLTKLPIQNFSIIFASVFVGLLAIMQGALRIKKKVLIISFIPMCIWEWYEISNHFDLTIFGQGIKQGHLIQLNVIMLNKVFQYIGANYMGLIIFSLVSFILIFTKGNKIERILVIPVIFLIIFVVIYYGWIFDGVDHESALRYMSSQILALFFLGGIILERILAKKM